jgi:hypothetical protein
MKIQNYQTNFDFFYTQNEEIIDIPKGTILYVSELITPNPKSLLSYIAVHYDIKRNVVIPASFIEKNKKFFDEINRNEVDEYLHFLCAIDLLKSSKLDRTKMINDLSQALNFTAIKNEDLEEIKHSLLEDEIRIGQAPVTRWTWNSSDVIKTINNGN